MSHIFMNPRGPQKQRSQYPGQSLHCQWRKLLQLLLQRFLAHALLSRFGRRFIHHFPVRRRDRRSHARHAQGHSCSCRRCRGCCRSRGCCRCRRCRRCDRHRGNHLGAVTRDQCWLKKLKIGGFQVAIEPDLVHHRCGFPTVNYIYISSEQENPIAKVESLKHLEPAASQGRPSNFSCTIPVPSHHIFAAKPRSGNTGGGGGA